MSILDMIYRGSKATGNLVGKVLQTGARSEGLINPLISRGLKSAGRFAVSNEVRPLIRGAFEYGALQGSASFIDRYSEGNFENSSTRALAGVLSTGLRLKSYHSAFMGVTGSLSRTALSAESRMRSVGPLTRNKSLVADSLGSMGNFLGKNNPVRASNLLRLSTKPFSYAAKLPFHAAVGTGEYIKAFSRSTRMAMGAPGLVRGWGEFSRSIASMSHPFAPAFAAGAVMGGANAFVRRYNPMEGFRYSPDEAPEVPDIFSGGAVGPVNIGNYGGGISYGRSGVMSQDVMSGQSAVTTRMLNRRRI